MTTPQPTDTDRAHARGALLPLYAAGFVTAFGAHSIAASLGGYTDAAARVAADPGSAAGRLRRRRGRAQAGVRVAGRPDRARPVLLGGLLAFAAASAAFVLAGNPALVGLARFGQGAAAAAFSPAAGGWSRGSPRRPARSRVRRLRRLERPRLHAGPAPGRCADRRGRLPAAVRHAGSGSASLVAGWAALAVPAAPPLPRARQTVARPGPPAHQPGFLRPTLALAAATAALSVGVGFLPGRGAARGPRPAGHRRGRVRLAATAALVQPRAGRARDAGRSATARAWPPDSLLAALGSVAALLPGIGGIVAAAVLIGVGTGLVTPIGFAHLAATTPKERLGQTMGAAEIGRELGDAGGPLLVGALAAAATLTPALLVFGALLTGTAAIIAHRNPQQLAEFGPAQPDVGD